MRDDNESDSSKLLKFIGVIVVAALVLVVMFFAIWPGYNVWASGKAGEAELAQADFAKQVQIVNAEANSNAAKFNYETTVTNAKGVAEANKIIGESLKDNPQYLDWLWIENVAKDAKNQIIYVPSGTMGMPQQGIGGLPLTEAGRATSL
jgi:hypothetical protein